MINLDVQLLLTFRYYEQYIINVVATPISHVRFLFFPLLASILSKYLPVKGAYNLCIPFRK